MNQCISIYARKFTNMFTFSCIGLLVQGKLTSGENIADLGSYIGLAHIVSSVTKSELTESFCAVLFFTGGLRLALR